MGVYKPWFEMLATIDMYSRNWYCQYDSNKAADNVWIPDSNTKTYNRYQCWDFKPWDKL